MHGAGSAGIAGCTVLKEKLDFFGGQRMVCVDSIIIVPAA